LTYQRKHNLRNSYLAVEAPVPQTYVSVRQVVTAAIEDLVDEFGTILDLYTDESYSFTCQFGVTLRFVQRAQLEDGGPVESDLVQRHISNRARDVSHDTCYNLLQEGANKLDERITQFTEASSGYTVDRLLSLDFVFIKKNTLTHYASSFIPTPKVIASKKAIINICNKNNSKCFLYAVTCALKHHQLNPQNLIRPHQYEQFFGEFIYKEEDFPMKICNITKFEKANNLCINVLRFHNTPLNDMGQVDDVRKVSVTQNPLFSREYMSKNLTDGIPVINLLLLENSETSHYCWIKNLNKLMNYKKGRNATNHICHRLWCPRCIRSFRSITSFNLHQTLCLKFLKFGPTIYSIPTNTHIQFTEWQKSVPLSYVVYADFESLLERCGNDLDPKKLQKHVPIMASYLLVPKQIHTEQTLPMRYEHFYGPDCVVKFLESLELTAKEVRQWYDQNANKPMLPLTNEQNENHKNAQVCYLCKKSFNILNPKVKDHCHVSGFYIGAAHSLCNIQRRQKRFLPVVFHNLRKYDMHHIMKHAIHNFKSWDLAPIAQTSETFLALTCYLGNGTVVRFIDSLQFVSASLDNAAKQLKQCDMKLTGTLPHNTDNGGKAIFPYSYVDNVNKLEEVSPNLPPYNEFFDPLTNCIPYSQEEYNNANRTYQRWGCHCLRDYYEIYLKIDVYLLADVFENFRNVARVEDGLEPLHFYSIPGLSWSSALKLTNAKLELLRDIEMYEWFESGIRGGMAFVNQHYAKQEEGLSELLYLDVNNLYGWALSEPLPCSGFKWIYDTNILNDLISSISNYDFENESTGYIFEIDVVIPPEMHDTLDQLPLFPNHDIPPPQIFDNGNSNNVKKLVLSHSPKTHYIIHGRLLQLYIELGARVIKVHRAVEFIQKPIFKQYVDLNTNKRSSTTDEFKRNYYKLRNNSLYGKTCENVRKHKQVKLCNTPEKLVKFNSSTRMRRSIEIAEDLIAIFLSKENIKLEKPIYIGQAVLDLSKLLMYQLYYKKLLNYASRWHNGKISIIGGDTDSFFLHLTNIPLRGLLTAMKEDQLLDTSNFHPSDPLHSKDIASKIGCVKDECGGLPMTEIIMLQPKCYSALTNDKNIKRAKGVQRVVLNKELHHENYKRIYNQFGNIFLDDDDATNGSVINPPLVKRQRRIGSEKHQIYTFHYNKVVLACRDNKRQWIEQNKSIAFGHHMLEN